jgi:Fe-S-cluster-containing dehydrogenase component/formate-dependent nitrite reductase membrane component NrfD
MEDKPVNYGFLIDNRKCIGCHACSTACKAENQVPLGVNRTWVKYVEKGTFPDVRRVFQVTRCNHCANPPCVRICPVAAMYQRADGIVDFDPNVCIGCKACLQACPYDAIYIDPETDSAAKCHFCAHRVEIGLEPACVVVCPERAIVAGDLDDPGSEISRLVAREPVSVRKPEQGTRPKLFYIDGDDTALTPTAPSANVTFFWSDVATDQARALAEAFGPSQSKAGQSAAVPGPIRVGGRMAEQIVQTAYNAQHKVPWHWPVPAYLVTKSISSGAIMLLALAVGLNLSVITGAFAVAALLVALVFIGLTTLLLVLDLEKPRMFITILTRPQWRSWLTRGAFILLAFSALVGLWFLSEMLTLLGAHGPGLSGLRIPMAWLGFPLAVTTAIYTAFLFGQAEGRDLWQSTLLPFHLLAQAFVAGAGALLALGVFLPSAPEMRILLLIALAVGLLVSLFVTLAGEFAIPHASEVAARAAHAIRAGRYRIWFWAGAIALGHIVPLLLIGAGLLMPGGTAWLSALAGLAAIGGLYAFEYAFVMAPQEVPNS